LFFSWFVPLVSNIEGVGNKIIFLLCSHAMAGLLHVQITISHFSMCTEKTTDQEEFFRHQLRTTMDVDCPEWLDWLHGGLQFQAIHHLFPRMPRRNLRKAREDVLKLCKKHGVNYNSYNFISGNISVINHLKMISTKINEGE
jgi:delta8-fatty-acid desaturase